MKTRLCVCVAFFLALLLPLISVAAAEDVLANFDGGNGNLLVDAYPGMPGGGWDMAWTEYVSRMTITASAVAAGDSGFKEMAPLAGTYLHCQMKATSATASGSGSIRRSYLDGIELTLPHLIEFKYRVDEDITNAATTFTTSDDRYQIFDVAAARGTANPDCSWIIGVYGSASAGWIYPEQVGYWLVYDGDNDNGAFLADHQVNSGLRVQPGVTYDFHVTVDPVAKTWDVRISDGTNVFTADDLGWRTSAASVAGRPQFGSIGNNSSDTRSFSLDSVRVHQIPEPSLAAMGGVLIVAGWLAVRRIRVAG